MSWKAELREAVRDTIREMMTDAAVSCTVKSVDRQAGTIVATDADELDYTDVRLKAVVVDGNGAGILVYPVVGSQVVVSIIDGIDTMAFVSQYSDIDDFLVTTASGVSLLMKQNGELHLNGDSVGGLVKAPELQKQLEKTNAVVDAIQKTLTNWVTKPNDGGLALKVAATTALAGLKTGDFSKLQNKKVKHGE